MGQKTMNPPGPNTKPGGEDAPQDIVRKTHENFTELYNRLLFGSATLDFPSTIATAVSELTISVPGAVVGDVVALGVPSTLTTTADFFAYVSAPDTVKVRYSPKATEDPASGVFKVCVIKY